MINLDSYINKVKHLPPAPVVAIQLLELFSDPDRDIDRIVDLISHDPALTSETLKRCNYGYFKRDEPVSDMFAAVSQLGFYEIYCIVSSLIGSRTMNLVRAGYSKDATNLWQHTVTTAIIAATLARRVQVVEATAFTAGLLHDIGKLILISVEGQSYAELLRQNDYCGPAVIAAESAAFGFNHADLGARLLERWGLPANICLAVRVHHQSPTTAAESRRLAAAVHCGNHLARKMAGETSRLTISLESDAEAMTLVELTPAHLPALELEIQLALKKAQGLMVVPS